jgi:hypothetical protein
MIILKEMIRCSSCPIVSIVYLGCLVASAQTVSLGVIAGVVSTHTFTSDQGLSADNSSSFLPGGSARLRTRSGIGFEIGVLRKDLGYAFATNRPGLGSLSYSTDTAAWQVPVLLQYGRSLGDMTPYMSVGPSFRLLGDGKETGRSCVALPAPACTEFRRGLSNVDSTFNTGLTAGGGLEFNVRFLQVSPELRPELRYTRWFYEPFSYPRTNQHQIDLILRIGIPVFRK